MFERRFGIRAYDYWNGYTKAQIELMIADQPFVSYGKKKKEEKATKKKMDALADAWEAKRKKDKEAGNDNPFGAFKNAKKTTLGEFFKNKK